MTEVALNTVEGRATFLTAFLFNFCSYAGCDPDSHEELQEWVTFAERFAAGEDIIEIECSEEMARYFGGVV